MNVIIETNFEDRRTGLKQRKADIHMLLGEKHTQCGKRVAATDEQTERRPTCLVCRAIFDPPSNEAMRVALDSPPKE